MRVLLVQRSLAPPGGGNAVAAWMVHALAGHLPIATLTEADWSPAATNAFYGTAIPDHGIVRHIAPAPWRWLASVHPDRLTRLRMCSVLRLASAISSQYDLLITADNFAALAKPGLQYVHFPARLQPRPARREAIVSGYFRFCDWLVGTPWSAAARNRTLVNSQWTARELERLGEITQPIVLYPPVVDPGAGLPWDERDDAFLCVGRFHGTKRVETAIAIVKGVRARVIPGARLLIVGSAVDAQYHEQLRAIAAREGS
jgi:glycosyltransferase involved in cell wall biosynthesis